MIRFRFYWLFIFIGVSTIAQAQIGKFDLSNYKLPELKRQLLDVNFILTGNKFYNKYPSYLDKTYKTDSKSFLLNANAEYFNYLNTAKKQQSIDIIFNLNKSKNYTYYLDQSILYRDWLNQTDVNLIFDNSVRKYIVSKLFYELNVKTNLKYTENKTTIQRPFPEEPLKRGDEYKIKDVLIILPLKFGYGRIEQVQDACQAYYLLKELNTEKRISYSGDETNTFEFAEFISKLKNKRIFDSRIRKIYELEAIDSFLTENNYTVKNDSRFYTTLQDYWEYGAGYTRESGTRISFSLIPSYSYYNISNEYFYGGNFEKKLTTYGGNVGFELKHEKPLNIKWQNSFFLSTSVGILKGEESISYSTNKEFDINLFYFGFGGSVGFYPNTRTQAKLSYSATLSNSHDKNNSEYYHETNHITWNTTSVKTSSDFSINYYISPKLKLIGSVSMFFIFGSNSNIVNSSFNYPFGNEFVFNRLNYLPSFFSIIPYSNAYKEKELNVVYNVALTYSIF